MPGWRSIALGLGVPVIGVLGMLPFISGTSVSVIGIPLLYFWMFLWFPLTSVCLWICWLVFDREAYEDESEPGDERGSR